MTRRERLLLFVSIVAVYLVHVNPLHYGANRYVYLAMALAEQHHVSVDGLTITYPLDLIPYKGHLYCNNNPGLSILAAPFWAPFGALLHHVSAASILNAPVIHFFFAHFVMFTFATAMPSALTSLLVGGLVFDVTRSRTRAIFATLLNAFGTIMFRFSTHLNQNVVITTIVTVVFVLLMRPTILGVTRPLLRSALVGLLLGFGVLVDLSIIPFGVACLPWLFRVNREPKALATVGAAGLPVIVVLGAFQYAAFGNPFRDVHSYYVADGRIGPAALIELNPRAFMDHLLLPAHGLLFFCPAAALGIAYLLAPPRGSRLPADQRFFALTTVAMYLLYTLLIFAAYSEFGPRYLMPILPLAIVAFSVGAPSLRSPLAVAVIGISFYVNLAGAQQTLGTSNVFHFLALYAAHGPVMPVFVWMSSPDVTAATAAAGIPLPEHLSPIGPLLLLAVFLVGLWIVRWAPRVGVARENEVSPSSLPIETSREPST